MNKPNTKCKVCGKEYYCCSDSRSVNSWRTMACSIECYKEYMNRIEKSRNIISNNVSIEENILSLETNAFENVKISKKKSTKRNYKVEDIIDD